MIIIIKIIKNKNNHNNNKIKIRIRMMVSKTKDEKSDVKAVICIRLITQLSETNWPR